MKSCVQASLQRGSGILLSVWMGACSNGMGNPQDAGTDTVNTNDGGLPSNFFEPVTPPFSMTTNTPLTVQLSVSGEALAQEGYTYTSNPPAGEPVFVDGWELRFDRYLVVVDQIKLNLQGTDPSMRSVLGTVVAQQNGPFVVDLVKPGPVVGAGGAPETAVPLAVLDRTSAGAMFDASTRYALSFSVVPASNSVRNTNLVQADRAALEQMINRGWTEYISGVATYRGRTPSAAVDSTFQNYPRTVRFSFGFRAAADYINCHNPEIGAEDIPANRGIQPDATRAVRAQITLHTDHFFWDQANVEGTPLHFDPFAARAQGFGANPATELTVTMAELMGVNPASLVDQQNNPVQDRGGQTTGYTGTGRLVYQVNGAMNVTDLRDFVVYNTRQKGHLNSDGLCFVQPNGAIAY